MSLKLILILLIATAVVSGGFASAEDATLAGIADTAPDTKLIDFDNKVRRLKKNLRRNPKVSGEDEERIVPVAAYTAAYLRTRPSFSTQTSQNILHAVENHEPLPKWAKALLVVLGLAAAGGTIFGSVKLANLINNAAVGSSN
ncbi:unnamed protein product [Phytophthora lilii]|uniref:Unnamed protein product n=1 Tax=Phytophthora lilii TaxID=2077276 RepID=A0A9W6XFX8_9STRA|nr:unnamed protein product [Phytophthora lilii]